MRLVEYLDFNIESKKSDKHCKQCKSRTAINTSLRLNPDAKIQKAKAKQLYKLICKRREIIFKKAKELQRLGNIDIYILISYKGKLFIYMATKRPL